jgi:hypothetical protein
MTIAAGSTLHLNGAINVQLPVAATVKSKAQIRTAPTGWTRTNNYKDAALASSDSATMNSADTDWAAAGKTCTTACHLSQASPAWGTPATCDKCHITLP